MSSYITAQTLKQLHTWLEDTLGCPLLARSIKSEAPCDLELEEEDIFEGDEILRKKMQPFIIPGSHRVNLFEWLIHTYDNTLLESTNVEEDRVESIVIALKQIGIINYNHRRGGTQNDLTLSVQGMNGLHDSI